MCHFLGEFGKGRFSGEGCSCEPLAANVDSSWDGCAQSGASEWGTSAFHVSSRGSSYTQPAPGVINIDKLQGWVTDITPVHGRPWSHRPSTEVTGGEIDPRGETGTKPDTGPQTAAAIVTPQSSL